MASWVLVVSLGVVLGVTLVPTSGPGGWGGVETCLVCGDFGASDAIANLLLFIPIGVGLVGVGARGGTAIGLGLLLSVMIETAQWRVVPGRFASVGDVAWNTLGAACGVALVRWMPGRLRTSRRALAAAAAALVLIAAFGLLTRPSLPSSTYFGQWTANLGEYEWYRGRVLSVDLGGLALPAWRLAASAEVRRRLLLGERLRVQAVAGPGTTRMAPLFSMADEAHRGILLIGVDRADLVFRIRTVATALRVRAPDVRWRGAVAALRPGDALDVEVRRAGGGYCLRLNGQERCGLAQTAGRAWALIQIPAHLSAAAEAALDCLVMTLLGLPLGLFMQRSWPSYAAAMLLLAGTVALPFLAGLAPTPPLQFGAIVVGIVAGWRSP